MNWVAVVCRIALGQRQRRLLLALLLLVAVLNPLLLAARPAAAASQIDIIGPAGSGNFGWSVTILPNGNIVVTDPYYDLPGVSDVGAVYLYNGATGAQISVLTGSSPDDHVGANGITVFSNSSYVVSSLEWDNGDIPAASALTWGDGTTGISGIVSPANSLVGSSPGDQLGYAGVKELHNGNYVVCSPNWDNGNISDAGAMTWINRATGLTGVISPTNSLVGSSPDDYVGIGVTELSNGNYVVSSSAWDNGNTVDAGAVTWVDGATGIKGVISPINSLIGSRPADSVGSNGVTALSDGNYVVSSSYWDNGAIVDAGAVTFITRTTGLTGFVSPANSLVGSSPDDRVGSDGVTVLSNDSYLVSSSYWDNGTIVNAGAVTFVSRTTGLTGVVSPANSLVGSRPGDEEESQIWLLGNGNYVVSSPRWNNGDIRDAGAVTWGNGTTGISGLISPANSLVGSRPDDRVGSVTVLSNGNYVVRNIWWDNGDIDAVGAVTWGNGATGISGLISPANSLVGSSPEDLVGSGGVMALSNGNYVVNSPRWDNGDSTDAGAVTWGNGAGGTSGIVSPANSLVGSRPGDGVGYTGVITLNNGNYVVSSPSWANGDIDAAGAATWGNGTTGISGLISPANSLVGSKYLDLIGSDSVTALSNGNYVVISPQWDNGDIDQAGAVTWGNGTTGISGLISPANSLVGSSPEDLVGRNNNDEEGRGVTALSNGNYVVNSSWWDNGALTDAGAITLGDGNVGTPVGQLGPDNSIVGTNTLTKPGFDYDGVNQQLVIGRPLANMVTLLRFSSGESTLPPLYLPLVTRN